MRRNDLTTDELRFERLLRSLNRGPAAPDPEFLRQLKETSTAAFLAARPAQPRAARVSNDPPPNPFAGRRRLRSLRVAIFSSVAALLLVGMLSPALFPSRGIELGIALDNLKRASSYEIEFQNGAGSNTLVFARGDNAALHWRRDFASGNSEVSDGISTYFVNRGNNSVHPSPLEEETIAPTFVEDELMAGLNVNDPAVQSSLMKQRPETTVNQNGRPVLVYNYQTPDKDHVGQTLSINATVNADNNTLLAINSEVLDANGISKFKANADVKSVNSAIPIDRFQIDPLAEPSEQIAMVEDVQGQAVMDDLTPLPAMNQAVEGATLQSDIRNRAANGLAYNTRQLRGNALDAYQDAGPEAAAAAVPAADEISRAGLAGEKNIEQLKQKRAAVAKAYAPSARNAPSPILPKEPQGGLGGLGVAKGEAGADKSRDGDSKSDALTVVAGQRMMKGAKAQGAMGVGVGGGGLGGGGEGQSAPVSAKKLAADRNELNLAAKDAVPAPPAAPAAAVARRMFRNETLLQSDEAESTKREIAKSGKFAGQKPAQQDVAQQVGLGQLKTAQNGAVADSKISTGRSAAASEAKRKSGVMADGSGKQKESFADAELDLKERQSPVSVEEKKQFPKGQMLEKRTANLGDTPVSEALTSQYGQQQYSKQSVKLNMAANTSQLSQLGVSNRLGDYGFVRRQVEVQSELHPGGVLKTDADPSNVVWARLANDADLVVGPGSEVLLLKPTEVRLQAGELMLNVPVGDQVDLLGPDAPPPPNEVENSRSNYRRNSQQLKVAVSRQQVTGRGVFRIENNQLQRVDQEPPWLANYFAKQSTAKQNSQSLSRQPTLPRGNSIEASGKPGMRPESATQQAAPRPK
ncbi:MAG: hypothetical protein JWN70_5166 [Planctomycetaceae bacterium]|nr:hypothetical protein [Planctomycetaceae bacterium]